MYQLIRKKKYLCIVLVFFLISCGGGGSDESMKLTVSSSKLSISGDLNSDSVPPKSFAASLSKSSGDIYIVLAHGNQALRSVEYSISGTSATITAYPKLPQQLGLGSHSDKIILSVCKDAGCSKHVSGSPKTIDVIYEVTSSIVVSPNISHSFTFGTGQQNKIITVNANNHEWSVSSSEEWLVPSVNAGSGNKQLEYAINLESLHIGQHAAQLTFTDLKNKSSKSTLISVQLTAPELTISTPFSSQFGTPPLEFGGEAGIDFSTLSFSAKLSTGEVAYPTRFKVSANLEEMIEPIESINLNDSLQHVDVAINREGLVEGIHSGTITLISNVLGQEFSEDIDIKITAAKNYLTADNHFVALVKSPSNSQLTHNVNVGSMLGSKKFSWTASSASDWLSFNTTGNAEDELKITAMTAGLIAENLYTASLEINSVELDSSININVSLWLSDNPSSDIAVNNISGLFTDPLRPYIYVKGLNSNSLIAYNIHSSSIVGELTNVGSDIKDIKLSIDGSKLFVYSDSSIYLVDATTFETLSSHLIEENFNSSRMELIVQESYQYLVFSSGAIFSLDSFSVLRNREGQYLVFNTDQHGISVSRNFKTLCGIRWDLTCYKPIYSSLTKKLEVLKSSFFMTPGESCEQVVLNRAGTNAYTICSEPDGINKFDITSAEAENISFLSMTQNPIGGVVDLNDNVAGITNSFFYSPDFYRFNSSDILLEKTYMSDHRVLPRSLAVSADGTRYFAHDALNKVAVY